MSRTRTPASPPEANLSPEQIRQAIPQLERRLRELEDFDPKSVAAGNDPRVTILHQQLDRTLARIFGANSHEYLEYKHITYLGRVRRMAVGGVPLHEIIQWIAEDRTRATATLQAIIAGFREEIEDFPAPTAPMIGSSVELSSIRNKKVFVVHGHDEAARESTARYLEKLDLEAIILHEQPNRGMTIIEKFETCASEVGFAVILLTPDDLAEDGARARQNVIFELGYFVGKIGRGKVCLLRKGDVDDFSDFNGVVYNNMDANGGWRILIARELKAAGFDIDLNNAL